MNYSKRVYIHHYCAWRMEEEDFNSKRELLDDLLKITTHFAMVIPPIVEKGKIKKRKKTKTNNPHKLRTKKKKLKILKM